MKRRKTPSKSAVLKILKEAGSALSQEMLQSELQSEIDRATIYRILKRFHKDGLIHKVVCDDGKQYFAYCTNCGQGDHQHNHFHFRCLSCRKVECLNKEMDVGLPNSYEAKTFNGVISGYCNDCRN